MSERMSEGDGQSSNKQSENDSSRPKKRVCFSEYSKLTLFPPSSREDARASWYSRNDIEHFKREARNETLALRRNTVAPDQVKELAYFVSKTVSSGGASANSIHGSDADIVPNNSVEMRGLEHLVSKNVLKLLLERRKLAISRVIHEQAMQKLLHSDKLGGGECDSAARVAKAVAQVSKLNSQFSKEWSSKIAVARAA